MITKDQVLELQKKWGDGVVKIGSLKENRVECEAYTSKFLDERLNQTLCCLNLLSVRQNNLDLQNLKHCLILLQVTIEFVEKTKVLQYNLGQR